MSKKCIEKSGLFVSVFMEIVGCKLKFEYQLNSAGRIFCGVMCVALIFWAYRKDEPMVHLLALMGVLYFAYWAGLKIQAVYDKNTNSLVYRKLRFGLGKTHLIQLQNPVLVLKRSYANSAGQTFEKLVLRSGDKNYDLIGHVNYFCGIPLDITVNLARILGAKFDINRWLI